MIDDLPFQSTHIISSHIISSHLISSSLQSHLIVFNSPCHQLEEKNKAKSKSKKAAKKDSNEYIRTETAVWSTEWSGTEEVLYYPLVAQSPSCHRRLTGSLLNPIYRIALQPSPTSTSTKPSTTSGLARRLWLMSLPPLQPTKQGYHLTHSPVLFKASREHSSTHYPYSLELDRFETEEGRLERKRRRDRERERFTLRAQVWNLVASKHG